MLENKLINYDFCVKMYTQIHACVHLIDPVFLSSNIHKQVYSKVWKLTEQFWKKAKLMFFSKWKCCIFRSDSLMNTKRMKRHEKGSSQTE